MKEHLQLILLSIALLLLSLLASKGNARGYYENIYTNFTQNKIK